MITQVKAGWRIGLGLVVLAAVPGAGQQAGGRELASTKAAFSQAAAGGDWANAARLAEQAVLATETDHVEALYAAAQAHARPGHRQEAYLFLTRAMGAPPPSGGEGIDGRLQSRDREPS